jgi:uncharacterized membrane protein
MSDLVAVAYPDERTARDVAATLAAMTKEKTLELEDLVVVTRDEQGKVKLHQTLSTTGAGAAGGALWGGLIGLLFLAPLLGMAIGAASGGVAGKLTDVGIDDQFMKDLGQRLDEGGAAVIVLIRKITREKVVPEISKYGGEVLHTSLSPDAEERLREALEGVPA